MSKQDREWTIERSILSSRTKHMDILLGRFDLDRLISFQFSLRPKLLDGLQRCKISSTEGKSPVNEIVVGIDDAIHEAQLLHWKHEDRIAQRL